MAEEHLREGARLLEVAGVCDNESARMAQIIFRLAQRVRSDRTQPLDIARLSP